MVPVGLKQARGTVNASKCVDGCIRSKLRSLCLSAREITVILFFIIIRNTLEARSLVRDLTMLHCTKASFTRVSPSPGAPCKQWNDPHTTTPPLGRGGRLYKVRELRSQLRPRCEFKFRDCGAYFTTTKQNCERELWCCTCIAGCSNLDLRILLIGNGTSFPLAS